MPNKNYENGRAKEYRVKRKLERENWFVIRSAKSHSPVDLVAFKREHSFEGWTEPLQIRFIQCKPKGGYLTPLERKEKAELEARLGIEIEVL